jgi:hypothetical protein
MNEASLKELNGAAAVEYAKRLRKVSVNAQTWEVEYIDDANGARWIMDYPHSQLQGGGTPRLRQC